ncbi:MAG: SAM-dependent methyltransferase [Candidatus Adiutrix sp.]|jgi:SAM-dependent methyltransferase|nr:SAM-dependent methyltransferase [Candidatus Adiutrix sp.]
MKEWTAPELLRLSGSYWACCAVQAAVQLDLFTALAEGPRTEEQLAAGLGCDQRALRMLVTSLVALEFLERSGENVAAPPAVLACLSRTSPEYLGFIIRHHAHIMPAWTRLAESVRSGGPSRRKSSIHTRDDEEREAFLMGMFNVARQQAENVARGLDLSGRSRLIDVGGGPGTYAVYFCLHNPGLTATVFDLPGSERFARGVVERYGLADRIEFVGGDFLRDELPKGQDVAWLSQVLHGEGPENAALLVKKAAGCLRPGGLLGIQEFVIDNDRTGPAHSALFSLNMLVGTDGGQAYTLGEIQGLLQNAGARDIRSLALDLPPGCRVLTGTV